MLPQKTLELASQFEITAQQLKPIKPSRLQGAVFWQQGINQIWGALAIGIDLFVSEERIKVLANKAKSGTLSKQDESLIIVSLQKLQSKIKDLENIAAAVPTIRKVPVLLRQLNDLWAK
jgi:hypothetical protein